MMELDVNKIEEKLTAIVEKVFGEVNEGVKKPNKEETSAASETQQTTIDPSPPLPQQNDKKIQYPDVKSEFFINTYTKITWWNDNKLFVAFVLLVLLAVFVFYKVFLIYATKISIQNI